MTTRERFRRVMAGDAAVDRLDVALVGQDEPSQRLGGKIRGCIY